MTDVADVEENDDWLYQREVGCREEREWGQVRSPEAPHTTGKMRRIHNSEQRQPAHSPQDMT